MINFKTSFKLVLFLLLLLPQYSSIAQAPSWQWAKQAGGKGDDLGYTNGVDAAGNIYISGFFEDTAYFDATMLICAGLRDGFLAKYSPDGNVIWVKGIGGKGWDYVMDVSINKTGDIYIVGSFEDTVYFDTVMVISNGVENLFLARYDTSGNLKWVKQAGHPLIMDVGGFVQADNSGNCFVTGLFWGSVTFDTITLNTAGGDDIFLAKYDPNGNVLWAKRAGSTNSDRASGVSLDSNGNCYITGAFRDTAFFDTIMLASSGWNDIFIAKYDKDGNVLWAKQAGSAGLFNNDKGYSISTDAFGNSHVTGYFEDTAFFDTISLISDGVFDVFIAKYDANGNVIWAKRAGGSGQADYGIDVDIDNFGNCYVTGWFGDTANFGSFTQISNGPRDLFVVKYDPDGNVIWVKQAGGIYDDNAVGITVDEAGYCYVTGYFWNTSQFDNITLQGTVDYNIFIAKLDNITGIEVPLYDYASISIYPNPAQQILYFRNELQKEANIRIFNYQGKLIKSLSITERSIDISDLSHGLYFLQITYNNMSLTTCKFIKL